LPPASIIASSESIQAVAAATEGDDLEHRPHSGQISVGKSQKLAGHEAMTVVNFVQDFSYTSASGLKTWVSDTE
jgi:hypothetical protein